MSEIFDSRLINVFGFWSGVLILKTMSMTLLTASLRLRKKVLICHKFLKMSTYFNFSFKTNYELNCIIQHFSNYFSCMKLSRNLYFLILMLDKQFCKK